MPAAQRLSWDHPHTDPDAPPRLLLDKSTGLIDVILERFATAASQRDILATAGIQWTTWRRWIARGETAFENDDTTPKERPYRALYEQVHAARARARFNASETVRIAGSKHTLRQTEVTSQDVLVKDRNAEGKIVGEHVQTLTTRRIVEREEMDWRAALAWLARNDPTHWAEPARKVELTGADGGPLKVTDIEADRADLVRMVDELETRRARKTG